jgi:hypothetical protein
MAETRRKFDQDFREGAVRLVRETGQRVYPWNAAQSGSVDLTVFPARSRGRVLPAV